MSNQERDPAGPPFPPWVYKWIMNPTISLILRSPLHRLMSQHLLLLTFTGHKSGKQFTTPVGYERWDDKLIVMTRRPWWKNFQGGAAVKLLFQGKNRPAMATAVTDKKQIADYIHHSVQQNDAQFNVRRFGLTAAEAKALNQQRLEEAAENQRMIEIELKT